VLGATASGAHEGKGQGSHLTRLGYDQYLSRIDTVRVAADYAGVDLIQPLPAIEAEAGCDSGERVAGLDGVRPLWGRDRRRAADRGDLRLKVTDAARELRYGRV